MSPTRTAPGPRSGLPVLAAVLALSASACMQPRALRGSRPAAESPALSAPDPRDQAPSQEFSPASFPLSWNPGQVLLQGFLGAKYLSDFKVIPDGGSPIELDDDEYEVLPVIGGGAQMKLAGSALDLGIEGFLAFSGRSDLEAFAVGGGGAVVAFDVNLLVFEAYGGPFVSSFVGERLRVYGSAGPLLQWVGYDQDDDTTEESADGSGGGLYARGGFEVLLPSGKLIGLGARWSDSSVDLGGDFGELDLTGLELYVTYSYGHQPRRAFGLR